MVGSNIADETKGWLTIWFIEYLPTLYPDLPWGVQGNISGAISITILWNRLACLVWAASKPLYLVKKSLCKMEIMGAILSRSTQDSYLSWFNGAYAQESMLRIPLNDLPHICRGDKECKNRYHITEHFTITTSTMCLRQRQSQALDKSCKIHTSTPCRREKSQCHPPFR